MNVYPLIFLLFQILSYRSLGPKNYVISYWNDVLQQVECLVKVRGFSLRSAVNKEVLNEVTMRSFVDNLLKGQYNSIDIKQWSIRVDPETRNLRNTLALKKFINKALTKRLIMPQKKNHLNYRTLPYGYVTPMLQLMYNLEETFPLC